MTYRDFCYKCFENCEPDAMLPNGTDAQEGLKILVQHFLGYLPVINYPGSTEQWNSEAIAAILLKYPPGAIRKVPKMQNVIDKLCKIGNSGYLVTKSEMQELIKE